MEYPNKDLFILENDVSLIWSDISFVPSNQNDDTKQFIIEKEKLNKLYVLGKITSDDFLARIRAIENNYRKKYNNEIHHGNALYNKFYEVLNKKYSHLINKKP